MYICLCNGYTDTQLRAVIQSGGINSAEEAYQALGAGFCCGACKDCANDLIGEELPKRHMIAAE